MTKKVSIGARPTTVKPAPGEADQWVESRTPVAPEPEPNAPSKRLTIDIPADLHRRIKSQCALRGTKIADEVRELLLQKYGNE
ncbi:MAG: plasmid partition protein ParG [Sphingomonas bacterium]|jgi:hypothetical protein|nr:plasmid partition protein ParG [Sphingomonas bacterium]